jgi:hypothetical protein
MGWIVEKSAKFTIAYDGPAVKNGEMDVRDLAPALLAVGQLFDAANVALYGQEAKPISVKVAATQAACFEIDLIAIGSLWDQAKLLLSGDASSAIVNLITYITVGSGSLIALIKFLKGKNPDKIEEIGAGQIRITFDSEVLIVPLEMLRLYRDVQVRKAVEKLIEEPLSKEGIDSFKILDAQRVSSTEVVKSEASYFIAPVPSDNILLNQSIRSAYSIVSLAIKEDNKWRLYDGNNQINATISDDDFLGRVDKSLIRFAKGDILICEVTVEQVQSAAGLKTNYTVTKVIEHKPALRQLDIFNDIKITGDDDVDPPIK